jgi:hypothetical protein
MADEKKIIIDEDWKSQVQAEKEAAAKSKPASPQSAANAPETPGGMPMPPASFELLLTMLATEALMALGHVPHPTTGEAHIHRDQAQYLIDLIDVLRTKTQGNLTDGEQLLLENILHQLRLAFVESGSQPAPAAGTLDM